MEILKKVSSLYHKLLFQISNNCTVFVRYSLWLFLDKMNLSKPGPKPSKKLFDTTNYVFKEVDMNSVKSQVWKYFLRDKKNGVAQCKICNAILKADQSTSSLNKHTVRHRL